MKTAKRCTGQVALALVVSVAWLVGGCGGDVTADQAMRESAGGREVSGSAAGRERPESPSFFDRLLGDRTREVTVPSGTRLQVRFSETLSSGSSSTGDGFRAVVEDDVRLGDEVVIPEGSVVTGRVTEAHQPDQVGGRARLSLEFTELALPSGESAPLDAGFARRGKSQNLPDAAIIAGSTIGGVVLGEAVDKGQGGVIGGILGGIGGAVAATKTKGRPVVVPAGTVMAIELERPVTLKVPA